MLIADDELEKRHLPNTVGTNTHEISITKLTSNKTPWNNTFNESKSRKNETVK